jgi:mycofactocin precursor
MTTPAPVADPVDVAVEDVTDDGVLADVLVEEISIDGMCGVY